MSTLIHVNGQRCNVLMSTFDNMLLIDLDRFRLSHIFLPLTLHRHCFQVIVSQPYVECIQYLLSDFPPEKQMRKRLNNQKIFQNNVSKLFRNFYHFFCSTTNKFLHFLWNWPILLTKEMFIRLKSAHIK